MSPDDTERVVVERDRDTIPCPPPSHVEMIGFVRPRPPEDSGIFTFALDCESLDED
jgi:hypothetical protein